MTLPEGNGPGIDPLNTLLAVSPATLSTAVIATPQGQFCAMTVRTPTTTVTILLNKADAKAWARTLAGTADSMSGLIIPSGITPNGGKPS